jgi:hypothetical protein
LLSLVVLAALGVWQLRRQPPVLLVLASAAFLLPLGLLLLSLRVPVLVPRYFAWGAGPFFVLAGAGLGRLPANRFVAIASIFGTACFVNLAPYYSYETKPRWDLLASRLATKARPGDVVLVNDYYAYYVFSVFAARANLAGRQVKVTWQLSAAAREAGAGDANKSWSAAAQGFAEASRLAAGHDLWVIYGRSGQGAMQPAEAYRRSLVGSARPLAEFSVGRHIVAWRYREPGAPEPNEEAAMPQACSDPCDTAEPHP